MMIAVFISVTVLMMETDATKALVVILLAGMLIQGLKVLLDIVRTRRFAWRYLWSSGGFPSFHAGISASVVTIIYLEQGISLLFVVALVFSCLLRYDAIHVRYEAGRHASYLNVIKSELIDVFSRGQDQGRILNERIGHTIPELVAGILIGAVVTGFLYTL